MGETNPQALAPSAAGPSPHVLRGRAKKPIIFGKYELLARFRVGGMAEVWTAKRLADSEHPVVALKRILPSFTDEADYLAMFRDEARLAQRLSHPCIVTSHEVGHVDDHPYIELEYVHGQNVAALIRKAREQAKPVPPAVALRIAIDICKALEHAHSLTDDSGQPLEVVHRDVSPTNILLGYDGVVKLIDFGIAKSNEQLMRTQAGLLKGKHGYLSPEQASGESVDARSDLFSLAICVWEMLAAKRLFLGASDFSSIVRVREAVVPPLAESGAPGAIEDVLRRALARDRSERYESATALREAFEHAAEASVEPALHAELATYLSEVFADEIALEAGDEALEAPAPYEGTGLLDAFEDLEPVSAVSALAAMPELPDESHANVEEDEVDDDLDLTEVSQSVTESDRFEVAAEPQAQADEVDDTTDLHKVPAFEATAEAAASEAFDDGTQEVDTQDVSPGELSTDGPSDEHAAMQAAEVEPVAAEPIAAEPIAAEPIAAEPIAAESVAAESVAEEPLATQVAEETTEVASALIDQEAEQQANDAGGEDEPDEPTRIVAYRSTESGEVAAAASAATDAGPNAATLPGMGAMEWDDEELSTHLYDGPSTAAHEQEAAAGSDGAPISTRPGVASVSSRPSVAPFSSRPIAPVSVRPNALPASVQPPAHTPAASTHRPPAKAPAWLVPALVAAGAVATFIALSMFQARSPGTIHLTTQPADTRVLFDGRAVDTTVSPFVIASIVPGDKHSIEVSRDGYRSWGTKLSVAAGQTLELPEVVLVPIAAAPAPHAEAVEPAPQPDAPAAREPRVEHKPPPSSSNTAPTTQQRPRVEAQRPPVRTPAPAIAPRAPAPIAPPVIAAQQAAGTDTGMLRVNSRPWAQIHVDGRLVGNTPQMSLRLSPGRHTVLLVNPEFGLRKTFTVQIRRGAVTTKIVELAR